MLGICEKESTRGLNYCRSAGSSDGKPSPLFYGPPTIDKNNCFGVRLFRRRFDQPGDPFEE